METTVLVRNSRQNWTCPVALSTASHSDCVADTCCAVCNNVFQCHSVSHSQTSHHGSLSNTSLNLLSDSLWTFFIFISLNRLHFAIEIHPQVSQPQYSLPSTQYSIVSTHLCVRKYLDWHLYFARAQFDVCCGTCTLIILVSEYTVTLTLELLEFCDQFLLLLAVESCPFVRLSVRHDPVLCQNRLTYRQKSFIPNSSTF